MSDPIPFPKPPKPAPADDAEDEEDGEEPSHRSPLLVLAIVAVLLLAGWFLAAKLAELARVQDCVLSGRHNCAPISTSNGN